MQGLFCYGNLTEIILLSYGKTWYNVWIKVFILQKRHKILEIGKNEIS